MKKRKVNLKEYNIDKTWTLFLDRDGVVNKRIIGNYILRWEDFEFLPGVLDAIKSFNKIFGKVVIVTNQQCIGKGIITENELAALHEKMLKEIEKNGGAIDAIFYAPLTRESLHNIDRKPNVGMALKAKKKFPEINFKKAVMAGDSFSDMEFGHRLSMITVLVNEDPVMAKDHPEVVCFWARDLKEFSTQLN